MKAKITRSKSKLKLKGGSVLSAGAGAGAGSGPINTQSANDSLDLSLLLFVIISLFIGFCIGYLVINSTNIYSTPDLIEEEDNKHTYGHYIHENPYIPVTQERRSTMNYPLQRPLKQIALPVYPTSPPEYPLRGVHTGFQQVGVLVLNKQEFEKPDISLPDETPEKTRLIYNSPEPTLLPLFGRKLDTHNDRWEYYCGSDKFNSMRLPVYYGNRDCQNNTGCNEIYDGEHISVPDYSNHTFRARIYKYNVPNAI